MAQITGGSSGGSSSGSGVDLPTGVENGVVAFVNGQYVCTDAADLKSSSVECTGSVSSSSMTSENLYVQNKEGTAGVTADETGVSIVDHETGAASFVGSDGITAGGQKITTAMVAGIVSGAPTSLDPVAKASQLLPADLLTPQGRIYTPPGYFHPTGGEDFRMTSSNYRIAIGFRPEIDMQIDAVSVYMSTVASQGNLALSICDNASAQSPDGRYNGNYTSAIPLMTASTTSGVTVTATDINGNTLETGGFEAWKACNRSTSADDGFRSTVAPNTTPCYFHVDFGADNAQAISRLLFWFFNNADNNVKAPPGAAILYATNTANPSIPYNIAGEWTRLNGELTGAGNAWSIDDITKKDPFEFLLSNAVAYRHYVLVITTRLGTNNYVAIGELRFCAAQYEDTPGTQLASLGNLNSGASATTWVRNGGLTPYQAQRNKMIWVMGTGQDTKDVSVYKRAVNSDRASGFPDGVIAKYSTDGGATWYRLTQQVTAGLYRDAMWVMGVNTTTHHTQRAYYGRYKGKYLPYHNGSQISLMTIPAAGIPLDCEALSLSTLYNAFVYLNNQTPTLEASTTAVALQDHLEVKSGSASHTFVGSFGVLPINGNYNGPVDVPDARMIDNRYNRVIKTLERFPGYYGATSVVAQGTAPLRLGNNDDFMIDVAGLDRSISLGYRWLGTTGTHFYAGLLIDGSIGDPNVISIANGSTGVTYSSMIVFEFRPFLRKDVHTIHPSLWNPYNYYTTTVQLYGEVTGPVSSRGSGRWFIFSGQIEC